MESEGHGYLKNKVRGYEQILYSYDDAFALATEIIAKNPRKCGGITQIGDSRFQLRAGKTITASPIGEYSFVLKKRFKH